MARKKPIISPLGQWAYPGEVTIIPSSKITMKGVNYPVLGVDDLGNQQMMMPGGEYTFPGNYVTEIPQMSKGGLSQWFDEKWVDVKTGKTCGRSGKDKDGRPYPACRPSKRVNETTPKTTSEMSSAEKARFKREKTSGKRIDYNHKRRELGGENWLEQYQVGATVPFSDSNTYSYDKDGNLIYNNDWRNYTYDELTHNINSLIKNPTKENPVIKKGFFRRGQPNSKSRDLNNDEIEFLKRTINQLNDQEIDYNLKSNVSTKVDKLNPSLDELVNVTQNIYPDQYAIDNSFLKASRSDSKINLPPSAFENDIKERYVIPNALKNSINKSFGTLPTTEEEGYSPNRIWTTKVKDNERSGVGAAFTKPGDYAYILTPNSKKIPRLSKDEIDNQKKITERSLSSINDEVYKNLYDEGRGFVQYPSDNNNPDISLYGNLTQYLPNQIWNRAEQMRVEMMNNPEIKAWSDLHNINLLRDASNENNKISLTDDGFAVKVPESMYVNRLVKSGLPVSTPDYNYGNNDTYIAQDPSKFNLAGYFPIPEGYSDENAQELIAKKLGIKQEQLNSKDYLIHYNKSPITEYTPGKKYGGWLEQYQSGGLLSKDDYDLTTAPKRGDYLLPDINRPYYIDDAGERRTEYKIGINVDGKETLIPTVVGGRQLTEDEARDRYRKTGLHMGQFNTPEEADYAARLRTARYKMLEDPVNFKANQFQVGGVRRPIYTSNPRDPRIDRYRDSLYLYNKGEQDKQKYINVVKNAGLSINRLETSLPPYDFISGKIAPIFQMSLGDRGSHGNIRYYEKQSGKTKLPYRSTAFNLDGDAEISDASNLGKYLNDRTPLLYKKPIAPIYYGVNTKPTASKKSILTKVSQPIYNKPEIIPDVVDIPLPVAPIEQPVKKIGYNKPIIQQFNYMSNENKAKALQKYGSVGDIPFQGVDINQLKDGGWLDEFQVGGRAPMYTSNPNDPRLQRFNDSMSLSNSNFFIPSKDVFYRSNAQLNKSFAKDINQYGLVRDGVKQNKKQKLEYIKGIQPTGYDNFPNKSDYNKGLSTEILFPEPVQPIIYQPSLAVSNIDRDMYTPNGGMAREYNIGVTLQDGSKKAFRTEKEYQDWKAANNLDISKAKVSEGRGYSYNYPENKKYGGWLSKYQTAGEAPPKSVEEYTNQFNEEISSLKDWYEANRKRIGDTVPEAYLRNDLKNAKKEYGPQPDPENYNPAVSDWEYDNPRVTGVRSKYNPVTNTFNERYIPPAFPFNFPELKIGLDNSKNTEESAIGIPNSYTYTNSRVKNNSFVVPYSSDYNKQLKNKGYIKDQKISVDPTAIDLYTGTNDPSTIMSHETSHYLNKNNPEVFLFNRTKLAEMGITDTEGFNNYYSTTLNNDRKEDELLSDAYALKQDMRKKGFYDYTKGEKLTPKIWNKYKKEYPDNFIIDRFTPVFENQGKNNIEELYNRNNSTEGINNIETLNDNYNITDPFSPHLKNTKETPTFKTSDERIIHLLNEIVKNKDQDLNIAKYGGWLNKYQTGGWDNWTPNVGKPYMRTSPAGNVGYSDNTRVVTQNTNVTPANIKAAEAGEYARKVGTISQGTRKSDYEKAREASSFVSQAERRKGSADPLDYVLDIFNPAAIGFAGVDLSNNLGSATSNTVQGNFAEAGSDLLGAGINALSVIPAAAEFKGIVKPLSKFARLTPGQYKVAQQFANNPEKAISQAVSYASKLAQSQIIKNPKLALSLQRGRPVSLDNVNTISGIQYGDVSSVANFNKIKPNSISEHAFFRQLEKGVESLDNSVSKRVADLESEEGFRRLVEQEKAYLFDNTDTDLSVIDRVAKLNAKARIEELKNVKNVNKEATEYANTNFLGTGLTNPFVDDSYLYNNAYHRPASLYDQFVKSSGTLNLKKPTPNYSQSVPGEIGMGYNFVGDVPTEMHEIGHVLQRGRTLSLDNGLKNIVPKKELNPINQRNYKYFKKGSSGSEPTAFANELREAMFQKGFIPDYYSPINQQQIQDAYKYFKKNPMGVYNKNTGNFSSNTRIFDFMEPNKANSKLLTDVLNRLPAVAPLAVGAAAASQLPEQKKGGQTSWLNKYK